MIERSLAQFSVVTSQLFSTWACRYLLEIISFEDTVVHCAGDIVAVGTKALNVIS